MTENQPSAIPDFATSKALEERIKNGIVITQTIEERNLPSYQQAARETGFKVEVIALPDQHYVTEKIVIARRRQHMQNNKTPVITAVKSQFPVKEGCVAISIEKPPGVKDYTPFHTARQKIQRI